MTLTAVLTPAPEGGFVAVNPETGTTTLGATVAEAIKNLKEAIKLYLSEFPILPVEIPFAAVFKVCVALIVAD